MSHVILSLENVQSCMTTTTVYQASNERLTIPCFNVHLNHEVIGFCQ